MTFHIRAVVTTAVLFSMGLVGCTIDLGRQTVPDDLMISQKTPAETLDSFLRAVWAERKDLLIVLSESPPKDFSSDCRGELPLYDQPDKPNGIVIGKPAETAEEMGANRPRVPGIKYDNRGIDLFKDPKIGKEITDFAIYLWVSKRSFARFGVIDEKVYKDEAKLRVKYLDEYGKRDESLGEDIVYFRRENQRWKIISSIPVGIDVDFRWGTRARECRAK